MLELKGSYHKNVSLMHHFNTVNVSIYSPVHIWTFTYQFTYHITFHPFFVHNFGPSEMWDTSTLMLVNAGVLSAFHFVSSIPSHCFEVFFNGQHCYTNTELYQPVLDRL